MSDRPKRNDLIRSVQELAEVYLPILGMKYKKHGIIKIERELQAVP